ncbi:MAG: hypothetical protein QUV05_18420 [Phycisphaerae bacterium]|nr:hypothetical protein [Phycisphaerae bacterium]
MSERSNAYAALLRDFRQAQADQNHQRLDTLCLFAATEAEYDTLCAKIPTFEKNWGGRIGYVVPAGSEPVYMLFGPTEKALLKFQELAASAGEWLPPEILRALNVGDCKPINRWLAFLWAENPPDRSQWKQEPLPDGSERVFRPVWDHPCRVAADTIERTGLADEREPWRDQVSNGPSSKPPAPSDDAETKTPGQKTPPNSPRPPRSFSIIAIRKWLQCSADTVHDWAKKADVTLPKPGQKDFTYPEADTIKILAKIAERCSTKRICDAAHRTLREVFKIGVRPGQTGV